MTQPAFALSLVAPDSVEAGAFFEIGFDRNRSADGLSANNKAVVRRGGEDERLLSMKYHLVQRLPLADRYDENLGPEIGGYGPWTFRAPPEPGRFDLCMSADRFSGTPPPDVVEACKPIEFTAPSAPSTTVPPAFALELIAPNKVEAGATFQVSFTSNVPAGELESDGDKTVLRRAGENVWLLYKGRAWALPLGDEYKGYAGSDSATGWGPWTLRAPPETGRYDLCREAGRPIDEIKGTYDWVTACTPIEIT